MKISKDYIAQAIDPKTKVVKYQSSGPDEAKLLEWFKDHAIKGKFAGLDCHIQKRYLLNGKPVVLKLKQKHLLWLIIAAQFIFIAWNIL